MIALPALLAASPALVCPLQQVEYSMYWATDSGGTSIDYWADVVPDGAGGAILCGDSYSALEGPLVGQNDATLRRVNAAGDRVWGVQIGTGTFDDFEALAIDGLGNIFATGRTLGTLGPTSFGANDAIVACYDLQGDLQWLSQIGSSSTELGLSVIADGSGGCIVAGSTLGNFGGTHAGSHDIFVARLDGNGTLGNVIQIGSAGREDSPSLASDGAGGYFLSTSTMGSLGGPSQGSSDIFLARYDASDHELWAMQIGTPEFDGVYDIAADGAGGVYVAGATLGDLAAPNSGDFDSLLGHFDGAGNQAFLIQSGANEYTQPEGLAWDPDLGRIYVAGHHGNSPSRPDDGYLAIYDPSGSLLDLQEFGEQGVETPQAVTPSGFGGVFLAGYNQSDFGGSPLGLVDGFVARFEPTVGAAICSPAVANSTGLPGRLRVFGSDTASHNNMRLSVDQLPPSSTCFFIASLTPGMTPMAGGSQGTLCLGGAIGRYVGPGQVQTSDAGGAASLMLDLTQVPSPTGTVMVMPGESWHFQAWNRDANPMATSNFSDAVIVGF